MLNRLDQWFTLGSELCIVYQSRGKPQFSCFCSRPSKLGREPASKLSKLGLGRLYNKEAECQQDGAQSQLVRLVLPSHVLISPSSVRAADETGA